VDHLVITGDLVESGQMNVVEAFLSALKERSWSSADRLTLIPGNHDIFPASIRVVPPLRRPTGNFDTFVKLTRGSRIGVGGTKLVRGEPFPFGKMLKKDVALVGMDTTRNGQYNPRRWAEGELQAHHCKAVEEFFAEHPKAKHRVVAMHHHPWREEFEVGWIEQNFTTPPPEEVEAWLRDSGATLVLCGHVHQENGIEERRLGKKCRVLRAGTAGGVNDEDGEGDKLRVYHLVDLEANGRVRIKARKFWDSEL
jgi:DNA repair exonuclease SbcCD nuclease subunit